MVDAETRTCISNAKLSILAPTKKMVELGLPRWTISQILMHQTIIQVRVYWHASGTMWNMKFDYLPGLCKH